MSSQEHCSTCHALRDTTRQIMTLLKWGKSVLPNGIASLWNQHGAPTWLCFISLPIFPADIEAQYCRFPGAGREEAMLGMSPNVGPFPVNQRTEPTRRTFWRLGWGGEGGGKARTHCGILWIICIMWMQVSDGFFCLFLYYTVTIV